MNAHSQNSQATGNIPAVIVLGKDRNVCTNRNQLVEAPYPVGFSVSDLHWSNSRCIRITPFILTHACRQGARVKEDCWSIVRRTFITKTEIPRSSRKVQFSHQKAIGSKFPHYNISATISEWWKGCTRRNFQYILFLILESALIYCWIVLIII